MKVFNLLPASNAEQPYIPLTSTALKYLLSSKRVRPLQVDGRLISDDDAWTALLDMSKCDAHLPSITPFCPLASRRHCGRQAMELHARDQASCD